MKKPVGCLVIIGLVVALSWGVIRLKQWSDFRKAAEANTVEAYAQFVTANKTATQSAEAAERAAVFIDKGDHLADWPDFLTALGENRSARPLPILAKYLRHPIAEVRRAAAAGLLKLAEGRSEEAWQALGDPDQIARIAAHDSDPHVRLSVRCLLWQTGRAELVDKLAEPSPFVQEGFAAYQKEHSATAR